jgi:hypothetical protein
MGEPIGGVAIPDGRIADALRTMRARWGADQGYRNAHGERAEPSWVEDYQPPRAPSRPLPPVPPKKQKPDAVVAPRRARGAAAAGGGERRAPAVG